MNGETSSMDESAILGCHPWMEKCHPWMSSMDGNMSSIDGETSSMDDIHGWHFSIHGWHPRMALSSMDEVSPSMDGIFICQIFGENCHRNWLVFCEIDTKWPLVTKNAILGCHPWIKKCHPWISSMDGEVSSMDGEMSSLDGSVIYGCYLWMTSMDEDGGWRTWTQPKMPHLNERFYANFSFT